MLFHTLPQIMGIGLGNPASFAIVFGRNGWELFRTPSQDGAVAFVQSLVYSFGVSIFSWRFDTQWQVCWSRRFMSLAQA